MPVYKNNKIEILNALQAYRIGYFTKDEYIYTSDWIKADLKNRQNNKIVYINGEYKGIVKGKIKLYEIVEKFMIG